MDFLYNNLFSFAHQFLTPADFQDILMKFVIAFLSLLSGFIVARITFKTSSKDREFNRITISGFKTKKELIFLKWNFTNFQYIEALIHDDSLFDVASKNTKLQELQSFKDFVWLENKNTKIKEFYIESEGSKNFYDSLDEMISNKQNFKLFKKDSIWKNMTFNEKYTFYKNKFISKYKKNTLFKYLFKTSIDKLKEFNEITKVESQLLNTNAKSIPENKINIFKNRYLGQDSSD
jgi:hypothetical protein